MSFRPAWWLPGPHLRTLWGPLARRPADVPVHTLRLDRGDGDTLGLVRLDARPHARHLILLHGLEGSARSPYIRGTLALAHRRGWGATVIVFRGCGGEPNRARRFYHSGETEDLDAVVSHVATEFPRAPLSLAGFSLGGNVMLKWLAERAQDAVIRRVNSAVAVSVPFDLARGARHIGQGFARVYERNFMKSLRAKALAKLAHYPDLVDRDAVVRARSIWDFDDVVTARVHGFRDAADYYARSSSLGFLERIRTKTLLLSAVDDPFLPPAVLDEVRAVAARNDSLEVEFVPHGGHVGFVGGSVPWRAQYYAEERLVDFVAGG